MDFAANNFSATYKVLVLGDSNVGKTCIVHRYCDERYYDTYISTIGKLFRVVCVVFEESRDIWSLFLASSFMGFNFVEAQTKRNKILPKKVK